MDNVKISTIIDATGAQSEEEFLETFHGKDYSYVYNLIIYMFGKRGNPEKFTRDIMAVVDKISP
jgi:hypothetical protein